MQYIVLTLRQEVNPKTEEPDKVMCGLLVSSTQVLAVLVKHPSKKNKEMLLFKERKEKVFSSNTITGCNWVKVITAIKIFLCVSMKLKLTLFMFWTHIYGLKPVLGVFDQNNNNLFISILALVTKISFSVMLILVFKPVYSWFILHFI